VSGVEDGVLRVRVRSAPADGAANAELVRVVAAHLDVPPSSVSIIAGHASRNKTLLVPDTGSE
jgi:uncharacterized protein YggU (UPF0235/DUF167 family)